VHVVGFIIRIYRNSRSPERQTLKFFFDVFLTVHLSIFISVINQLEAQNFCFTVSFILCLYMFRAHVLIIRRSELHYTASGITYRCDESRCCVMQFWPPDDEHMCSKHVEAWNKTYCKTKILCIKLVNYSDKLTFWGRNYFFNFSTLCI